MYGLGLRAPTLALLRALGLKFAFGTGYDKPRIILRKSTWRTGKTSKVYSYEKRGLGVQLVSPGRQLAKERVHDECSKASRSRSSLLQPRCIHTLCGAAPSRT